MAVTFTEVIEDVGKVVDAVGVGVIVAGVLVAAVMAICDLRAGGDETYRRLRQRLGRAILLGLELLVAADIIRTVGDRADVSERRGVGDHRRRPHVPQLEPRS